MLGSLRLVSLEDARRKRDEAHKLLRHDKRDPLAHRAARHAKAAAAKTFFEVAELFIREMQAKGRDMKTLAQTNVWLLGRSLKKDSTWPGSRLKVRGSISTKTGRAPARTTALADAKKLKGVVRT